MMPYLTDCYGNPGSMHAAGREARQAVDDAREQVSRFFRCAPEQVIFTSGGSEGNNLVVKGISTELRKRGRTGVVISDIEHDSLRRAAMQMKTKGEFSALTMAPPNKLGFVGLSEIHHLLTPDVGFASVMLVNNETGTENDVKIIADSCRARDVLFHTDAVQAAGLVDLDTHSLWPVDFMTVSSHKINGPKGVGAVFAREPKLLAPLISGGAEQEFGFRGGTENVAGIVGFGKACELAAEERDTRKRTVRDRYHMFMKELRLCSKEYGASFTVNGGEIWFRKTVSICFHGVDAQTLLLMLDAQGICMSAGSACRAHENLPSHTLKAMGLSDEDARSTVRVSFSHLNTVNDVVQAAEQLAYCASELQNLSLT